MRQHHTKKQIYSIRKISLGIASIAIGSVLMGTPTSYAEENISENSPIIEETTSPIVEDETPSIVGDETSSSESDEPATSIPKTVTLTITDKTADAETSENLVLTWQEALEKVKEYKESYVLESDPSSQIEKILEKLETGTEDADIPESLSITLTSIAKDIPSLEVKEQEVSLTFSYTDVSGETKILKTETITGKDGDDILYDTRRIISEFKRQGYVLKNDGFLTNDESEKFFDSLKNGKNNNYTIELIPKIEVVSLQNGATPKPGEEIEPGVIDSPRWPQLSKEIELTRQNTHQVNFRYHENGENVFKPIIRTVEFERYAMVNLVTGEIIYSPWVISRTTGVQKPQINPTNSIPEVVETFRLTHTKNRRAVISYVDLNTNTEIRRDELEGEAGYPIEYSTLKPLSDLKRLGYDLIDNGYDTVNEHFGEELIRSRYIATNTEYNTSHQSRKEGLYFYEKNTDTVKEFKINLTPRYEWIFPNQDIPRAGTKVDEDVKDSPVYPRSVNSIWRNKSVNRTIEYKYRADNSQAQPTIVQTVPFYRTAKVNLVTAEILYRPWETDNARMDSLDTPFMKGYIADFERVEEITVAHNTPSNSLIIYYKKLGSWIPISPLADLQLNPIQYPNDKDKNPTKAGLATDEGVEAIPYVEDYIALGPDGTPLTLLDPSNPSKGYQAPDVPEDPTQDTFIRYQKEDPKTIIPPTVPPQNPQIPIVPPQNPHIPTTPPVVPQESIPPVSPTPIVEQTPPAPVLPPSQAEVHPQALPKTGHQSTALLHLFGLVLLGLGMKLFVRISKSD